MVLTKTWLHVAQKYDGCTRVVHIVTTDILQFKKKEYKFPKVALVDLDIESKLLSEFKFLVLFVLKFGNHEMNVNLVFLNIGYRFCHITKMETILT